VRSGGEVTFVKRGRKKIFMTFRTSDVNLVREGIYS
jgi:hypothetical protein